MATREKIYQSKDRQRQEVFENVVGENSVTLTSSRACVKGFIRSKLQCASKVRFPSKIKVKAMPKEPLLNHGPGAGNQ